MKADADQVQALADAKVAADADQVQALADAKVKADADQVQALADAKLIADDRPNGGSGGAYVGWSFDSHCNGQQRVCGCQEGRMTFSWLHTEWRLRTWMQPKHW